MIPYDFFRHPYCYCNFFLLCIYLPLAIPMSFPLFHFGDQSHVPWSIALSSTALPLLYCSPNPYTDNNILAATFSYCNRKLRSQMRGSSSYTIVRKQNLSLVHYAFTRALTSLSFSPDCRIFSHPVTALSRGKRMLFVGELIIQFKSSSVHP